MTHEHPLTAAGITPNYLTTLLADASQVTRVDEVSIADAKTYGEQFVSTAGRVIIDVRYGANPDGLPSRLVIKLARDDKIMGSMYANEVAFYRRIRPELSIERSEEHTSELQSLMRISYAVFCLKKNNITNTNQV